MGIEIRPTGEAKATAKAGQQISQAKAAETARQEAAQQQEIDLRTRGLEWEMEKAQMRSAQDFAHELRVNQARLEGEARAKEWEVEKLDIVSKADFMKKEQARLDKHNKFTGTINYIDELEQSGNYSPKQIQDMKIRAALPYEREGFDEVAEILGAAGYFGTADRKKGLFDLGGEAGIEGTAGDPLNLNIQPLPVSQLSQEQLSFEQQNKFEVISPDGKTEIIDATDWAQYKADGYILSSVKKQKTQSQTPRSVRKVGSIKDLYNRLTTPIGSINELRGNID